jgi:hypothetical protein
LGVTERTDASLESVCNFAVTHNCTGRRLPASATDLVKETCLRALGNLTFDFLESNKTVLGSYIVRELMRIPRMIAHGKSTVKFALESSHASAVAAVMVFLADRLGFTVRPQLAAYVTYELWKADADPDYAIRWAVNGIEIPLRQMGNATRVAFQDFLTAYADMDRYCVHFLPPDPGGVSIGRGTSRRSPRNNFFRFSTY